MSDLQPFRRLGIVEAAEYLGTSVTTLRRLMVENMVAYVQPPRGAVVFDTRDLDMFIAAYRIPAAREIGSAGPVPMNVVAMAQRIVKAKRGDR